MYITLYLLLYNPLQRRILLFILTASPGRLFIKNYKKSIPKNEQPGSLQEQNTYSPVSLFSLFSFFKIYQNG